MNNLSPTIATAFFGTSEFAAIILEHLTKVSGVSVKFVVTQPDAAAGRGRKINHSPVYNLAVKLEIPILQPESIKRSKTKFLKSLSSFRPIDISVVAAFGQIIPIQVLEYARCGSVNVHASLLPRWRGAAPIQRAILSGDSETGVCIMKMDAGLDTGPVYSTARVPITPEDNAGSLHDSLAVLGANLLAKEFEAIVAGEIEPKKQALTGAEYAAKISNEECEIDWNATNTYIHRKVRALSPFPGAFTYIDGKRLKIFSATLKEGVLQGKAPGTVVAIDRDRLEVQCASGILSLSNVQLQDRKRMNIDEFLRGLSIAPGTRLGRAG